MNIGVPLCPSEQSLRGIQRRHMGSVHILLLCVTLTQILACGADEVEIEPCYVCLDDAPYAFVCQRQVGLVIKDQDDYVCNLFFGLTHQCQSLEFCCERANVVSDPGGQCSAVVHDAFLSDAQ
ncbi:MAG: hypothetical protein ACPGQS_04120 [Bradymonadia bacterium]